MKTNIDNLDMHLKTLWANINDNHLGGVFDILSDAMVELNMIRMKTNGIDQSVSNCNIPLVSNSAFVEMLQKQQNKVCNCCGDIEKAGWLECGCQQDGFNKGINKAIEMFMKHYC